MAEKSDNIVIFENPQNGMAPHPALGIGLLRGIDTETYPGVARLNKDVSKQTGNVTFTVTIASPGVFSKTSHGLYAGVPIKFSTTGALPTGLNATDIFYVISAGLTADAFQVSTSRGGSAVNTSGSQSGTHTYTTVTGTVYWMVRNPVNGDLYALDASGQVHKSTTDGALWSPYAGQANWGSGEGLAIWKGFLLVARATQMDAVKLSDGQWTASFLDEAMDTATWHTMLASVDDNLYITCDRYVYKLKEEVNGAFDPTAVASGTNYSETKRAISLPTNYHARCLSDLGVNLMVAGWFGDVVTEHKVADIFPYNRSTLTLGIPIKLGENGVHAMIPVGNRLYVIAGLNAKLFITDGVSAVQVAEIPNYAINLLDTGLRVEVYPGAICYHRGKILFGLRNPVDTGGTPGGNVGVWGYNPYSKRLSLENIISTGSDGTSNEVAIGSLFSSSHENYLIGWKDFTSPTVSGIDLKSQTSWISSYGGIIETQIVHIGTALGKRTIESIEFFLVKPFTTGQGIRIKYRKDLTSSFTTLATIDYANYGAVQTYSIPAASITKAIFLQLRIELTSGGNDTPELFSVILKPSN